jgi:hypothetical protein
MLCWNINLVKKAGVKFRTHVFIVLIMCFQHLIIGSCQHRTDGLGSFNYAEKH